MRRGRAINRDTPNAKYPSPPKPFISDDEDSSDPWNYRNRAYPVYNDAIHGTPVISDRLYARKRKASDPIRRKIVCGCAYCSFVGMSFLLFVGILFELQPLYIKGLLEIENAHTSDQQTERQLSSQWIYSPKYNSRRILLEEREVFGATSNAIKASFAYFCTILLCLLYNRYDAQIALRWSIWRRRWQYRDFSEMGNNYIFRDNRRNGYGTFERWKRKIVAPGKKWFKDNKSKRR